MRGSAQRSSRYRAALRREAAKAGRTEARELRSEGMLMTKDEDLRRYMRTRGLLDSEELYVYETILAPGAACGLGRGHGCTHVLA